MSNEKPMLDGDADQRRTDEVLKRLLHTPPTPHKKKRKRAKKPAKK